MTTEARSTRRAHHSRPPSRMRLFVSGRTGVLGGAFAPARGHGRPRARAAGPRASWTCPTPPPLPPPSATPTGSCTWRPGSARSSSARTPTRGARTTGCGRRPPASCRCGDRGRRRPVRSAHRDLRLPAAGPVSETTPIAAVPPTVRSALATERQTARFAAAGGRGVVLRFGLLDRPGTGNDAPEPEFGATLHVHAAARVLLAALTLQAASTTSVAMASASPTTGSPR
jgi:hypothetical protein